EPHHRVEQQVAELGVRQELAVVVETDEAAAAAKLQQRKIGEADRRILERRIRVEGREDQERRREHQRDESTFAPHFGSRWFDGRAKRASGEAPFASGSIGPRGPSACVFYWPRAFMSFPIVCKSSSAA